MLDPDTIVSALAQHELESREPLARFDANQVIETLETATARDRDELWHELRLWVASHEGWLVPTESSSEIRIPRDAWVPPAAPATKAPAKAGRAAGAQPRRRRAAG